MWKHFTYNDKVRVAWVPKEGPSYQVFVDGENEPGFRHFKKEKMKNVKPAGNFANVIDQEDLEDYPELKLAFEPTFEITVEDACFLLECGLFASDLTDRLEQFVEQYCGERI